MVKMKWHKFKDLLPPQGEAGDGCEYALGAFIGVLVWPAEEYWAEWIGLENSNVQSRNY